MNTMASSDDIRLPYTPEDNSHCDIQRISQVVAMLANIRNSLGCMEATSGNNRDSLDCKRETAREE